MFSLDKFYVLLFNFYEKKLLLKEEFWSNKLEEKIGTRRLHEVSHGNLNLPEKTVN